MSLCTLVSSMACPRGQALLRGTSLHASAARAATPAGMQCRLRVPISATGRIQVRPACAHRRPSTPGAATRPDPVRRALFWAGLRLRVQQVQAVDRHGMRTLCDRCISPIVTMPRPRGGDTHSIWGILAPVVPPPPKEHAGSAGRLYEHHTWLFCGPPRLQQQLMRWYDALGQGTTPVVPPSGGDRRGGIVRMITTMWCGRAGSPGTPAGAWTRAKGLSGDGWLGASSNWLPTAACLEKPRDDLRT
jgi:hypothetical protein